MSKKTLFCICGETASGKDSMVNSLIDFEPETFHPVCSYTNRPPRIKETEGVEHYFLSREEFENLKNEKVDDIIAYTKIESDYSTEGYEYMALKEELEKANIYIIDPKGIKYLREKCGDEYNIVVFYIYAPLEQRRERARNNRSDFNAEFENRVLAEKEQFDEFVKNKEYDHMICNLDGMFTQPFLYMKELMQAYLRGDL